MELTWREVKKLYRAYDRDREKYEKVTMVAGNNILRDEPKWGLFNAMPFKECIAYAFLDEYPEEALSIVGKPIRPYQPA